VSLSLIIAGLISVTILFQINESQIDNKLDEVKTNTTNLSIQKSSEYRNYKPYIEKARQKYFEKEAQSNCLRQAEIGKTPDFSGIFTHEDINMEAAPKDIFFDIQSIPTKYTCPLKSPKPCRSSTGKNCPEVISITKALKQTNKDYKASLTESKKYKIRIEATAKKRNISVNDFSGQVQAIALYYEDLYNGDKTNFLVNIGIVSPFLIILLLFELLPTIAKLTFPHSSYDRLIADEELYYELKSMALINKDANKFLKRFTKKFKQDLKFLKEIRDIEYKKKCEFSSSVDHFIDSFKTIILEVTALIKQFGSFLSYLIVIIIFLAAVLYFIVPTISLLSELVSSIKGILKIT
jgi:hypothetical protein